MKKILMILMVILAMTVLAGCDWLPFVPDTPAPVIPVETLSADVEIINWVQDEGEMELTYEITNTGTVDIAYYKIQFEITYEDGSSYITWFEKEGIAFAGNEIIEIIIPVAEEVTRVDVVDLKLTEWKFK